MAEYWRPVPRLWPGETVVIAGGGPSLAAEDLAFCRGKARVVVINNAFLLAPWADLLHASDRDWWRYWWIKGASTFAGIKTACQPNSRPAQDFEFPVYLLRSTGPDGLELDPALGIRTGGNSGHQAINLAVHLGAARILLLGFDMQAPGGRTHWHGDHEGGLRSPRVSDFDRWRKAADGLTVPLRKAGIEVLNCSRETALHAFPFATLSEALP